MNLKKIGKKLTEFGSRSFDQVNMLDNNRTWQQRKPTNNRSVIGQATHNAATNVVGGAAKAVARPFGATANYEIQNAQVGLADLTNSPYEATLRAQRDRSYNDSLLPMVNKTYNRGMEIGVLPGANAQNAANKEIEDRLGAASRSINKTTQKTVKEINQGIKSGKYDAKNGKQVANELLKFNEAPDKILGSHLNQRLAAAGYDMNTSKLRMGAQAVGDAATVASFGIAPVTGRALASMPAQTALKTKAIDIGTNATLGGVGMGASAYGQGANLKDTLKATATGVGLTGVLMAGGAIKPAVRLKNQPSATKPPVIPNLTDLETKRINAVDGYNRANDAGKTVSAARYTEDIKKLDAQIEQANTTKNVFGETVPNTTGMPEAGGIPIGKLFQRKDKTQASPVTQATKRETVDSSPNNTPQIGAQTADYTDYLVNKYIDSSAAPAINQRNPLTRASTQLQEIYRGGVDKARDAFNEKWQAGLKSENPIIASIAEKPSIVWNRFGMKDSTRTIFRTQRGNQENAGRVVRTIGHDLGQQVQALADPATSMQRIDRFFEEPEYLKRAYGDGKKVSYEKLAPEEQRIVDTMIDMNKLRNDINLELGNISPELHAKYADGTHSPRLYDLQPTKGNRHSTMMDANVGKKRVALKDIEDDTFAKRETNPIMRSLIRAEVALRDKATFDALKQLESEGLIKDSAPNKNFTQLNGSQYGKFNGKYIYNGARNELSNSLTFNTKMGQAIGDLIDAYQDSPLGMLDRFFKSTKTTLSPATTAGNIISNPVAFNPAAGVNMFTQGKNMAKTSVKMVKDSRGNFDRSLYEARKQGVGVGDTGKQLTGDKRVELEVGKKNSKNPYKVAGSFYGGVDQTAQVALYDELIKRGLSPEVAARRVMAGTQDYGGVGRGVQSLADAPVLGKPFARFTPELMRLTKNNIIYNPVGTAAKVAAVAKGGDALSKASGETEEERKAREEAVGQTQIPYTNLITKMATGRNENLSLNFAVPKGVPVIGDSSVNVARLSGLNYPIEPGGDATAALKRQLNPVADLTRKDAQGNTVIAPNQMVSSLTGRPIADQIANRDFMGRSITDPENKTYVEGVGEKGKKLAGAPSTKEQRNNRIRAAKQAYVPFANEEDSVRSSIKGQKDYYGKERTKTQGVLRAAGLKVESNSKEARKKRVENKQFFEGKAEQVNKFLRENPDLKNSYSEITSNTRTRDTNTKTRDIISPEKWTKIKSDTSGRLFKQFKQESLDANKRDGQPIDPIYQLNSPERVKEVMELRSRPTGDDIEREEILKATTTWYPALEKAERKYNKDNQAYFDKLPKGSNPAKQNPRVQSYLDVPYSGDFKSDAIKQYESIKYGNEDKGIAGDPNKAKEFYKANATALSADYKKYSEARLKEINAKRAIEGASPISQDTFNNVTFGYEDDESKVAKELYYKLGGSGYGSGGSGGGGGSSDPYKYAVSLDQGSVGKPKVFKVSKSKAVAKKKISKPKVSIKKSLV